MIQFRVKMSQRQTSDDIGIQQFGMKLLRRSGAFQDKLIIGVGLEPQAEPL